MKSIEQKLEAFLIKEYKRLGRGIAYWTQITFQDGSATFRFGGSLFFMLPGYRKYVVYDANSPKVVLASWVKKLTYPAGAMDNLESLAAWHFIQLKYPR